MTVLVLDNPELLARATLLEGFQPNSSAESHKPHQLKFLYGYNKHQLSAADMDMLTRHGHYLRQNVSLHVRVHGHSDAFGSDDYGRFLSRMRASAVVRFLVEEGVDEQRLKALGWGSDRPLATRADHAANRRVELEYVQHIVSSALSG
ncbi:MAG TPA: OmpA family protein [Marinobacter sp.]|nr:OmpA family protein [Marinobacter sp.]